MGVYIHLIKLKYAHHAKAGVLRPIRFTAAKVIRFDITYNKLDQTNGIPDDELSKLFCMAVRKALDERREKGYSIIKYDGAMRKIYHELPDGTREYL